MRKERSNRLIVGILALILIIFVFFEPSYGWRIREFFGSHAPAQSGNNDPVAENETLQAQLAELKVVATQLPTEPANNIRAMVYSRYPLNFKNELLVNAGTNEGVATGSAVTYQGIFIGQIEKVFSDTAIVQTVFDDNLKIPVRIGNGGYDGLLEGDPDPSVASIAKISPITSGDIIYAAAPGIPYGLAIGQVSTTSTSPDSLFQTADISFAYDINNIETVFIVR